jgi:ERCC4-type nuclease
LEQFGSVERTISADALTLAQVGGLGPKKAAKIRDLVTSVARERSDGGS